MGRLVVRRGRTIRGCCLLHVGLDGRRLLSVHGVLGEVPFDFANRSLTFEDVFDPEEDELMSMISLSSSLIDRLGESSVVRGGAADDDAV
jgi:hypothetical protein